MSSSHIYNARGAAYPMSGAPPPSAPALGDYTRRRAILLMTGLGAAALQEQSEYGMDHEPDGAKRAQAHPQSFERTRHVRLYRLDRDAQYFRNLGIGK